MAAAAVVWKVLGPLTRIDVNTMVVSGLKIYIDVDANGKYDRVWSVNDFQVVDGTGLSTLAKLGVLVRAKVLSEVAATPWVVAAPENVIVNALGKTFDTSATPAQQPDPETTGQMDTVVAR